MAVDLTVKGEAVERIFGNFIDKRYQVNRRYQRKLVWTLDEKRSFIDSLIEGYPVPIILLAESIKKKGSDFEIIDGMQRLDAIVSFITNRFSVRGAYFDLNTMAVTKALLDNDILKQKAPLMEREICVALASYILPLSIYEFTEEETVDTVFRRINSGGRKLSRQELRSAGSVDNFATVVRKLSAKVRGDDTSSDVLPLNEMQKISITNRELDYGIDVDGMFWVKQGVLTRENVRHSKDEELIADLVAYMVSDEPLSSRTEFLDDFYGMSDEGPGKQRFVEIDSAIQKRSSDLVILDFQRVLDQIKLIFDEDRGFVQTVFSKPASPSPRYFQVIFLAFYELIVRGGLEVSDRPKLLASLQNIGDRFEIQEGGRWGAENRQKAVEAVIGMIQGAFVKSTGYDPAMVHWITQLQNLLNQSYTEQAAYDFKQGFLRLDGSNDFDEESFSKILKACVAISNIGKAKKGYVIVGITDEASTAARVEAMYGVKPLTHDNFYICGIEHEAVALGKSLDKFFQFITNKIGASPISEPLKSYITSNIKSVRYYHQTVYVFEVVGQDQPSLFDNTYYQRSGANVEKVENTAFPTFFAKYNAQ